MNQTNLRKLRDELASQAALRAISHSLPVWTDGAAPYLTDAAPWKEMERVAAAVAASLSIAQYEPTIWSAGWDPPRNAANLNRLETQAQTNRAAIDNLDSNWPASFYTGPLGSNEILPTYGTAFLGLQPGGIGYSVASARTRVEAFESEMGRVLGVYQFHNAGNGTWDGVFGATDPTTTDRAPGGITQEQYAINKGSVPMLSWVPDISIADQLGGAADAIWDKMADYLKTYAPNRIMLRAFTEFNLGPIYGIAPGGGSPTVDPSDFILAWRNMVDRFQARGATNVGFGFCMDEGNNREWINSCYPGDAYVDWITPDTYNTQLPGGGGSATPLHTGAAEWWELFNYTHGTKLSTGVSSCIAGAGNCGTWSMYDIFSAGVATRNTLTRAMGQLPAELPTQKPYFIGETGCIYHSTFKPNWYPNILTDTFGIESMPNCIGISFYDSDVHAPDNFDWRVDSNAAVVNVVGTSDPTTRAAFVAFGQDAYMQGGV
jgi:hypothetical protein